MSRCHNADEEWFTYGFVTTADDNKGAILNGTNELGVKEGRDISGNIAEHRRIYVNRKILRVPDILLSVKCSREQVEQVSSYTGKPLEGERLV